MGVFARIKQGLQKTSQVLQTDIRDLFKQEGRLVDDDFLQELFAVLVRTDMGGGPAVVFGCLALEALEQFEAVGVRS